MPFDCRVIDCGVGSRPELAARNGPQDDQWLLPGRDGVGQWGVRQFVRQIFFAGKEPQERSALLREVVADRPAQHGIADLERVEDRTLRGLTVDLDLHLAADVSQGSQMLREYYSDHIDLTSEKMLPAVSTREPAHR